MLVVLVSKIPTPDVVYPVLRVALEADRGREFHHGSPYHHTEDNARCDWVSGTCYGVCPGTTVHRIGNALRASLAHCTTCPAGYHDMGSHPLEWWICIQANVCEDGCRNRSRRRDHRRRMGSMPCFGTMMGKWKVSVTKMRETFILLEWL